MGFCMAALMCVAIYSGACTAYWKRATLPTGERHGCPKEHKLPLEAFSDKKSRFNIATLGPKYCTWMASLEDLHDKWCAYRRWVVDNIVDYFLVTQWDPEDILTEYVKVDMRKFLSSSYIERKIVAVAHRVNTVVGRRIRWQDVMPGLHAELHLYKSCAMRVFSPIQNSMQCILFCVQGYIYAGANVENRQCPWNMGSSYAGMPTRLIRVRNAGWARM